MFNLGILGTLRHEGGRGAQCLVGGNWYWLVIIFWEMFLRVVEVAVMGNFRY